MKDKDLKYQRLNVIRFFFALLISGAFLANANTERELLELEAQVQRIKEKVYKAKAQVKSLETTILKGDVAGSRASIQFQNTAENIFSLKSAKFFLDGNLIYQVKVESVEKPVLEAKVFDEALSSGEHELKVVCEYKGTEKKKTLVPFKYFKDQEFILDKTHKFIVDYGKTTGINVVVKDKGYFKENIKNRLQLSIQVLQDWGLEASN